MEQTLEKKIEDIWLKNHYKDFKEIAKALVTFIEDRDKEMPNEWITQMTEEPVDFFMYNICRHLGATKRKLLIEALQKYPTYESYSLKKGEEDTERGLG